MRNFFKHTLLLSFMPVGYTNKKNVTEHCQYNFKLFHAFFRKINNQLRRPVSRNINNYAFDYYLTTEEIFAWLDRVAAEHPDVVTLVTIGNSNDGRPIRGVKIDFKKQNNPVIGMIEGGIHAREWISPATVTFIIEQFLTSTDPQVRFVAENIVWHIFPVVNPDGYSYTFTNVSVDVF